MRLKKKIVENKLCILFISIIISISIFLAVSVELEADYYWHLIAGKYMFNNHTILTKDIFSWYLYGKEWISHEWLFEYILYCFKFAFNQNHVIIFSLILVTTIMLLIHIPNLKNYKNNIAFSLLWISFSIIFIFYIQLRPHLFSYIFFALSIYILYDLYKNENSKKIYSLPVLSVLWANVHGGSSNLVYLLPLLFMITGIFQFCCNKIYSKRLTKRQYTKLILITIISFVFLTINPHGIKMLFYPYQNLADVTMINTISEWQPTNLNNIMHYPYYILVIIIVIILLFSEKKINMIDMIMLAFTIFLGLKAIRFWPYTYIVSTYFICNYIKKRKKDNLTEIVMVLIIISFLFLALKVNKINDKNKIIDDYTINYLKDVKPKRLYNYYDYGGYLIYNDIKVFIDGRADLYSKYNYKNYHKICNTNNSFIELISKYNFDYYIVKKNTNIDYYLYRTKEYVRVIK